MTDEALFLFGTLRHPPLLQAVAGADLTAEPAVLDDHAVAHALSAGGVEQPFPLLFPRSGSRAQGVIIRPDPVARQRLDAYERVFGYDTTRAEVTGASGPIEAAIYVPRPGLWSPGRDWSLQDWARLRGDLAVEVAREVMARLPGTSPEAIAHRYAMLENRVSSRQRARAMPGPADLRRRPGAEDVAVDDYRYPYDWFFGVEEADLRFRRFDNTLSPRVTRAGFVMGDAVTVLPYDPVRDRVMVVEQFRFGPMARGDANPWSLEPIAGRIDPRETPEAAARREAREETGLEITRMEPIARYYVSPGAVSEYLFSYLALTALPDEAEGVGGLETEAEDIRAHVIGFDRFMALVASGEVENGPLLISAQWLVLNRARLRQ